MSEDVRRWEPVGERESIVAEGKKTFGLGLWEQQFTNPKTGEPEPFVMFTKKDGVTICAVTEEGSFILVRQFKQGAGIVATESPAGLALKDESPATLAAERLRKETGYEPQQVVVLTEESCLIAPRKSPSGFFLYVALGCTRVGDQDLTDREEDIQIVIATPQEFWGMIDGGVIRSCETLLAATLAARRGLIPVVPYR